MAVAEATELVVGKNGFALPLDVVTEAVGIIATRGAGKSYGSVTLIEEAIAADVQTVVLDPTGVYHGLRAPASGSRGGLPVYVLGGPHGDVPLEAGAGHMIAELVVDSGHSFVLDLSDFSKTKARTFVADFLERLYDRKARARTTLLLVCDEADEFAPQKARGETARVLGAMETIVKRGRSRGIGCVLISQRTQAINKDVLDLIDTLIVMRIVAPRGRDVIREWIDAKEARDEAGVIESLSSMPTGNAWLWSPVRGVLERFTFRRIRTFDSYATPKPGEARVEPAKRRELDLDALGDEIRATVEKARENDPAALRKRIRELEAQRERSVATIERPLLAQIKELEETLHRTREAVTIERVEVPVFPEPLKVAISSDYESVRQALRSASEILDGAVARSLENLEADFGLALEIEERVKSEGAGREDGNADRSRAIAPVPSRSGAARSGPDPQGQPPVRQRSLSPGLEAPSNAEQRVLNAIAWWRDVGRSDAPTREQIAVIAGYKVSSGGFRNLLGSLRTAGLVDYPATGLVSLTDAGAEQADSPQSPSTNRAMWSAVFEKLSNAQAKVLGAAIEAGRVITRDELAAEVGYEPTSGGYRNLLGSLRTLGFIEYPSTGAVRAADVLFPEGR